METRLSEEALALAVREDAVLVAEADGELIGFVQLGDNRVAETGAPGDQEVRRLYVAAEHQGRGVGGALIEAALAHPRIPAGATVFLTVWEDNFRARAFSRRHGFVAVGTCRLMLANGPAERAEVIMARRAMVAAAFRRCLSALAQLASGTKRTANRWCGGRSRGARRTTERDFMLTYRNVVAGLGFLAATTLGVGAVAAAPVHGYVTTGLNLSWPEHQLSRRHHHARRR